MTDDNWRDHAACRGLDVNMFFPSSIDIAGHAIARSICREECPVVAECLADADAAGEFHEGVRGGLSADERYRRFRASQRQQQRAAQ